VEPSIGHPIRRIGFADKYFTFWDVSVSEGYIHFHYIKNLSMNENEAVQKALKEENDIVKVDTTVDYELRGNSYFKRPAIYIDNGIETVVDFGKYSGKTLKEIIETDSQYFLWLSDNCSNLSLSKIINNLDWLKEHKERIEKEIQEKLNNPIGNFVCEIGKRQEFKLKISKIANWDSDFGSVSLYVMKDEFDNVFTWKTSPKGLEKDKEYKLLGTVKDHVVYNGIKQTELTRCKIK
jgi:hypothetical protein